MWRAVQSRRDTDYDLEAASVELILVENWFEELRRIGCVNIGLSNEME